MMGPSADAKAARGEIVRLARRMLHGDLSWVEGGVAIYRLHARAHIGQFDPDMEPFLVIDSETDRLPYGKVRELWSPEALARLKPDFERAEAWAAEIAEPHCRRLIQRFGKD